MTLYRMMHNKITGEWMVQSNENHCLGDASDPWMWAQCGVRYASESEARAKLKELRDYQREMLAKYGAWKVVKA